MIISVDHGNKSIKTPNALFTSGLIVSEGFQGFKTDYICWNNKYYTTQYLQPFHPRYISLNLQTVWKADRQGLFCP